jgi:hypothetical protein
MGLKKGDSVTVRLWSGQLVPGVVQKRLPLYRLVAYKVEVGRDYYDSKRKVAKARWFPTWRLLKDDNVSKD